jgi:hypothetical protein
MSPFQHVRRILLVCVLLILGLAMPPAHADDLNAIPRAPALQSHLWPTTNTEVVGYNFDPSSMSSLQGATVTSDELSHRVLVRVRPVLAHYDQSDGYRVEVTRTVVFQTADSKELSVRVRVSPSLYEAHRAINVEYTQRSHHPLRYRNIAGDVSGTGDACIVHDAEIILGQNDAIVPDPNWDVNSTRSLYSLYHNVLLDLSVEPDSSFQVLALLQEMIAGIESQRVAANGSPELPTVSLDLPAATVQAVEGTPGASISMSYSSTWDNSACQRRFFVAQRVDNLRWDEDYEEEPDPVQPYTYRSYGPTYLDDKDNPTKTAGWTETSVGHYHVVMVAWGDNLLPKVIYKPLEVTAP